MRDGIRRGGGCEVSSTKLWQRRLRHRHLRIMDAPTFFFRQIRSGLTACSFLSARRLAACLWDAQRELADKTTKMLHALVHCSPPPRVYKACPKPAIPYSPLFLSGDCATLLPAIICPRPAPLSTPHPPLVFPSSLVYAPPSSTTPTNYSPDNPVPSARP